MDVQQAIMRCDTLIQAYDCKLVKEWEDLTPFFVDKANDELLIVIKLKFYL